MPERDKVRLGFVDAAGGPDGREEVGTPQGVLVGVGEHCDVDVSGRVPLENTPHGWGCHVRKPLVAVGESRLPLGPGALETLEALGLGLQCRECQSGGELVDLGIQEPAHRRASPRVGLAEGGRQRHRSLGQSTLLLPGEDTPPPRVAGQPEAVRRVGAAVVVKAATAQLHGELAHLGEFRLGSGGHGRRGHVRLQLVDAAVASGNLGLQLVYSSPEFGRRVHADPLGVHVHLGNPLGVAQDPLGVAVGRARGREEYLGHSEVTRVAVTVGVLVQELALGGGHRGVVVAQGNQFLVRLGPLVARTIVGVGFEGGRSGRRRRCLGNRGRLRLGNASRLCRSRVARSLGLLGLWLVLGLAGRLVHRKQKAGAVGKSRRLEARKCSVRPDLVTRGALRCYPAVRSRDRS